MGGLNRGSHALTIDVGLRRAGQFDEVERVARVDTGADDPGSSTSGRRTSGPGGIHVGDHDLLEHLTPGRDRHDGRPDTSRADHE